MTSISSVSVPASGVSARPSAGAFGGDRARPVQAPGAAPDRQTGDERRSRAPEQALSAWPVPPPDPGPTEAAPAATQAATPTQRASAAYRKAGAEPSYYGPEPRLYRLEA